MANRGWNIKAGGGSRVNRLRLLFPAAVVLLGFFWSWAGAQESEVRVPPPPPRHEEHTIHFEESATRDSLVVEIHKYSKMISAMRDSLSLAELGLGIELGPEEKASIEKSIQDFTQLIEEIGSELGQMDLEISENRISLLDAQGEGIIINIPENIDEQLSQGLNVLTSLILSELPDSVGFQPGGDQSGWKGIALRSLGHREKRKVVKGNIVKVWDRLQVSRLEDVRGHVVVVFGDAEVSGRVDGNVVVVFGDLQLTETAEVTGEVVAIGGRLDQDPDADVNDVTVVDPWRSLGTKGPDSIFNPGPMNFLLGQGEFLAMLIFAVLACTMAPARRLESITHALSQRPLPSLGAGLLGSLVLHLLALAVMAILVLTVIGIPVALLVAVAMVVVGVLAVGQVALVVGRLICHRFSGGCASAWVGVIIGLVALHSISFLGQLLGVVPGFAGPAGLLVILGASIKVAAYFFGLGALILSRFGSVRPAPSPESPVS
jgi:hypothetical protein